MNIGKQVWAKVNGMVYSDVCEEAGQDVYWRVYRPILPLTREKLLSEVYNETYSEVYLKVWNMLNKTINRLP